MVNFHDFSIFDLWVLTIRPSKCWRFFICGYQIFFQKVSSYSSFRKKMSRFVCIILFPTAILVFFPKFPYIDLWANFHLWVYHRIFYGSGNFSSKSMESHLSNALSNAFIALLVAEISSFQFHKFHSSHLWAAFSHMELQKFAPRCAKPNNVFESRILTSLT